MTSFPATETTNAFAKLDYSPRTDSNLRHKWSTAVTQKIEELFSGVLSQDLPERDIFSVDGEYSTARFWQEFNKTIPRLYLPCAEERISEIIGGIFEVAKAPLDVLYSVRRLKAEKQLLWTPFILDPDEKASDVPSLCTEFGNYLSWFRGYRMQVSGNSAGVGDCGSSSSTLAHNQNALHGFEYYRNSVVLAHTCMIYLLHASQEHLSELLTIPPEVVNEFYRKTLQMQDQLSEPPAFNLEDYTKMQVVPIAADAKVFPLFGKQGRGGDITFVGRLYIAPDAVGIQMHDSSECIGFKVPIDTPPCAREMMLYICAALHGLGGAYSGYAPFLQGTSEIPEEFPINEEEAKSFHNLYPAIAYLQELQHKWGRAE